MSFKPGQWVIVDTSVAYWPVYSKEKRGPFKITHIDQGLKGKFACLEKAPNNAYFKELTLYTPQVGDKVKILKPMINYSHEDELLPNTVGQTHIITEKHTNSQGKAKIRIREWWYLDEEGVYELVEPKGSINVAAQAPDAVKPQPTKRVLNA